MEKTNLGVSACNKGFKRHVALSELRFKPLLNGTGQHY